MTSINPHIFRAYDIRGKALTDLTEEAAELIGRGFGSTLIDRYDIPHPRIVVGRDARTHSPLLENAVVRGLMRTGCSVSRIGQTPSPVNYFTICTQGFDSGIQVTASHNPAEDNGLKLQMRSAEAFAGEDIQRLRAAIERRAFIEGKGRCDEIDAITPYVDRLTRMFPRIGSGLSIVVDAGNGVAGPVNCAVLKRVGCSVTELYTEPDGTFPHHQPDPSKHDTLRELQAVVLEKKAHCGIAFDGDGDRVGIVDETGMIRSADEILLLLAQDHLQRFPAAPVIFTVSNSSTLETEIRAWGGNPVWCKVGHSFVEHAMHEHRALLGGEQSGHFFCGEDYFGFDDALVAALRVLRILRDACTPFSCLFSSFPRVFQAKEMRPRCSDETKQHVVDRVIEHFAQRYPVNTLDGARIDFGDGAWTGIRKSNTSPCLSICIEARTADKLQECVRIVTEHLRTYPEIGPITS